MKKDIESLIAQEKAEIVAKYEKVPASCLSPECWLRLKLFHQLGMHQIRTFASLQALPSNPLAIRLHASSPFLYIPSYYIPGVY